MSLRRMATLGLALGLSFAVACRLDNLERRLDPINAGSLNKFVQMAPDSPDAPQAKAMIAAIEKMKK